MRELDELDKKILEALQKDGRMSYTEMAEMFNANVSTVSNHIQRLKDNGILKVVGVVNPFKTGNPFVADIRLKVNLSKLQSVINKLKNIKEVRFIAGITGSFNLVIEVYTSSNEELYQLISETFGEIDGIEDIDTSVVLEVHKQSYNFGVQLY